MFIDYIRRTREKKKKTPQGVHFLQTLSFGFKENERPYHSKRNTGPDQLGQRTTREPKNNDFK